MTDIETQNPAAQNNVQAATSGWQSQADGMANLQADNAVSTAFIPSNQRQPDIDLVKDIPVQLSVELGRTKISIKQILQLAQGSVIELNALAGEPMDVFVNGCLIAQGEVVVTNEKFGVRLTDIVSPTERVARIGRK